MSDGAAGDVVGACLGVSAHGVEIDVPGEFDSGSSGDIANLFRRFLGSKVVEQQVLCARGERLIELSARAHFNFNRHIEAAEAIEGSSDSTCRSDVVVLDENGVV